MTEFALIRHAETLWNQQKRIQGHEDSPLSQAGEHMACAWGRLLNNCNFHRILASDLGRAVKSAELINHTLKIPLTKEREMREMDWGQWTGGVYKEIRKARPDLVREQVHRCWKFQPPGGENRIDVLNRSMKALQRTARMWPGERILVVTHEGVIRCLVNHFLGRTFMWDEPEILKHYHLHKFHCDANGVELRLQEVNAFSLNIEVSTGRENLPNTAEIFRGRGRK